MNIKKVLLKSKFKDIFDAYGTDFSKIVYIPNLPIDFIDIYFMRLKPYRIEKFQILDEYILRKYEDKINWILALQYQTIPEDILEKRYNILNKVLLFKYQKLSLNFINSHIKDFMSDKSYFEYLKLNKNISNDILNELHKSLN